MERERTGHAIIITINLKKGGWEVLQIGRAQRKSDFYLFHKEIVIFNEMKEFSLYTHKDDSELDPL